MTIRLFEVGGCVRDAILGIPTKDIDYSVEIPDLVGQSVTRGFDTMRHFLVNEGFEIFVETPEHMTIRARFPKGHPQRGRTTADFVLCRIEGPYSDGRRPDWVKVGTLADDLRRRDFTVNAMARDEDGSIIDLHRGQADLERMVLRCVGDPRDRLREDALRAMRALRFVVCKGFTLDRELDLAIHSEPVTQALREISVERREHELRLMFQHDTLATLDALASIGHSLRDAAMHGIKLNPTHKRRLPTPESE
jgi:tRNA nucleotidyltransferase/poly(A) polymerase